MIIFHPLHQSLDLACQFPEKERKWVLFRNSAWVFPPKGPVLEAPRAGAPLSGLAEAPRLRDRSSLPVLESYHNQNECLKSQMSVCRQRNCEL